VPFAHACNPTGLLQYYYYSNPQEAEVRKIEVQSQPRKIVLKTLSRNYPTQKMASRVAQVIQHLPSKCEALSLNPNTTKKKKKGKIFTLQKLMAYSIIS
jgi:hypothetical protein